MTRSMVLLGAGASVEAGVPTAMQMTKDLLRYLEERGSADALYSCCARFLRVLEAELRLSKVKSSRDGADTDTDIEELVSTVKMLATRHTSPLAPFVHWRELLDWRRMPNIDESQFVIPFGTAVSDLLRSVLTLSRGSVPQRGDSELSLAAGRMSSLIREVARPESWDEAVAGMTWDFIHEYLDSILWTESGASDYLSPLALLSQGQESLVVASLNYDLTLEQAIGHGSGVDTGLDSWRREGVFPTDGTGVILLKLHGSVDWEEQIGGWIDAEPTHTSVFARTKPRDIGESRGDPPYLVFAETNKLRPTGPFLDLMMAYKTALTKADRLFAIGYSFRDEHVNEPIRQWLHRNREAEVVIVDPGLPYWHSGESLGPLHNELVRFEHTQDRKVTVIRRGAREALASLARHGFDPSAVEQEGQ